MDILCMGKHEKKSFHEKLKQTIFSPAAFGINNVFEISREIQTWL